MVTTSKYDYWAKYPEDSIVEFKGSYFFLSNYYECKVIYDGLTYESSEAAFQAQKCKNKEDRLQFIKLSPSEAKHLGRKIELRPDWDDVRFDLMKFIVKAKFDQNPNLKKKLINTKDRYLIEGNTWHDKYWGVEILSKGISFKLKKMYYLGEGNNMLGNILMLLRHNYSK